LALTIELVVPLRQRVGPMLVYCVHDASTFLGPFNAIGSILTVSQLAQLMCLADLARDAMDSISSKDNLALAIGSVVPLR